MLNIAPSEILLVEDIPADLELALRALRKAHLSDQVHIARDGAEAIEFLFGSADHPGCALSDPPQLIMLDLKLPKVDGLEVLRRLRADAQTRMIPVIVLSSSQEESDLEESYQNGANSYMVKPVNIDQFVAILKHFGIYWKLFNRPAHALI